VAALNYDEYKDKVPVEKRNAFVTGEILRWSEDMENNQTLYIIHKDRGVMKASVFYRGSIKAVTVIDNFDPNVSIACL
jgi:hypothetical protein